MSLLLVFYAIPSFIMIPNFSNKSYVSYVKNNEEVKYSPLFIENYIPNFKSLLIYFVCIQWLLGTIVLSFTQIYFTNYFTKKQQKQKKVYLSDILGSKGEWLKLGLTGIGIILILLILYFLSQAGYILFKYGIFAIIGWIAFVWLFLGKIYRK